MPKLTDVSIRALQPPQAGQKVYWDELPGFGVRVSQGGTKTFILVHGKARTRTTIGRFPIIGLSEARQAAKTLLAERTLTKTLRRPPESRKTVLEAISAFLEHSERNNRPRTTADYRRLLHRHMPQGKLKDLTKHTLLDRLNRLAETPAEQSHAMTAFKVFLNWCAASGLLDHSPLQSVRGVGRIKKRERTLTREELRAVFQHGLSYGPPFGTIVCLLILTGQRKSEIGTLRAEYIQEDRITLPQTKNNLQHTFPIGSYTKSLLPEGHILFPGLQGRCGWLLA